jgi:hypothetical protein
MPTARCCHLLSSTGTVGVRDDANDEEAADHRMTSLRDYGAAVSDHLAAEYDAGNKATLASE